MKSKNFFGTFSEIEEQFVNFIKTSKTNKIEHAYQVETIESDDSVYDFAIFLKEDDEEKDIFLK